MSLATSKAHRILNTKMRVKPHVVKPEWVWDSLDKGRRVDEWGYRAFESASARVLPFQAVGKGKGSGGVGVGSKGGSSGLGSSGLVKK